MSKSRVFVGRLPPAATEDDIKNYFSRFGEVIDIYLPKRKDGSGVSAGYGFVSFTDKAAMYKALSTPQHFMGQDEIKVNEATAKSQPAQPAPMQPMGSGGVR